MTQMQKVIKYCAIALAVILIVAIIGGILKTVATLSSVFGADGEDPGEMESFEITDGVRNLKISLSAAELVIKRGDALSLESNGEKLRVRCENGWLTVQDQKRSVLRGTVTVILTVPEGYSFDRIDIEAGAGNVNISDLTAERFSMELGAGNVDIHALNVTEKTEIEGGTGRLSFSGSALHDLEMGLGVGDVTMEAALSGDCEIECGVGKAEISLLGNRSDYSIAVEKGIGKATVNGESVSNEQTVGNGKNKLEIHGGIGSVSITVAE